MRMFNTHPQALHEFRRRTAEYQGNAQSIMTYAYKCRKCGAEMRKARRAQKHASGRGWVCPQCVATGA
jgi:hypothetical protein